ncbi:MAG: hypothetical protein U5K70_06945 [Halodesulfurarchaeum sp.]|nr:hypothetical protein [Halodesulfurarchaeum sp.]
MPSVIAGLVGGLVATIVMSIGMKLLGGGPPPTAALLAKFMGGEPAAHAKPGMLLHMIYGTGAGLVFALGVPVLGFDLGSIGTAVGLGLGYGLVLMVGGMAFWLKGIIGMKPDRDMLVTFGIVHVVYGLVLGAFLGTGLLA